jgi:hypothetical protein
MIPPSVPVYSPHGIDVDVNSEIFVTFSEEMDQNTTSIILEGIDGEMQWESDTIYFVPSTSLEYETNYIVIVEGTDLAGNQMEFSWEFTTGEKEQKENEGSMVIMISIISTIILVIVAAIIFLLSRRIIKRSEVDGSHDQIKMEE